MHPLYIFSFDYITWAHAHPAHSSSVPRALASHARDVPNSQRTRGLSGRISWGPRAKNHPDFDTAHQRAVPTQPLRPYQPRPQRAPTCPAHPRAHPHVPTQSLTSVPLAAAHAQAVCPKPSASRCCGPGGFAGRGNRSFGGSRAEFQRCGHSPRDGVHGTQEQRPRTPQPPVRLYTLVQRERRPTRRRGPYLSGQGGPCGVVASR